MSGQDCSLHRWENIGFGKCLTHNEVFLLPEGTCPRQGSAQGVPDAFDVEEFRTRVKREIARCEERIEASGRSSRLFGNGDLTGRITAYKIVLSMLPKEPT